MENLNKPPMQNNGLKSKKIVILILLVIGIMISASLITMQNVTKIGQDKIGPIVNTFFAYASSGDELGEYEMYSSEVKKGFSLEDLRNTPTEIKSNFNDIKTIKATKYDLLDDRGQKFFTYTGLITYNNNTRKMVRVVLVYENSNWKINSINFSKETY